MVRRLASATTLLLLLATAASATTVLAFGDGRARVNQGIDFGFLSPGGVFATARGDLLAAHPDITFVDVTAIDQQALVGVDVVLLGPFSGALSDEELAALAEFRRQGGGIFGFGNEAPSALADLVGASASLFGGTGTLSVIDSQHALLKGANLDAGDTVPAGAARGFDSLGADGVGVLETTFSTASGPVIAPVTAVFSRVGHGTVVLWGDEEVFATGSVGGVYSGKYHLTAYHDALEAMLINSFDLATPGGDFEFVPVPEPALVGLAVGAAALALIRRRGTA